MRSIQLSERQERIIEIVRSSGPITSEQIAALLHVSRAALRPDLAILTMSGFLEARPRVGYFFSGKSARNLLAEHLRKLTVKQVKSVPVVVTSDTVVYDAVVTMFTEDVGTLFVVGREKPCLEGVVSRKDLLKATLGQASVQETPVSVIMTRWPNIVTTTPEDTIYHAARLLIEHQVDSLPVVRPAGANDEWLEVCGRFTKTNIARLFVELGEGR